MKSLKPPFVAAAAGIMFAALFFLSMAEPPIGGINKTKSVPRRHWGHDHCGCGGGGGPMFVPKKRDTKIYANAIREADEPPITYIGPNDVVTILEVEKKHYIVRTASNIVGFVLKRELKKLKARPHHTMAAEFEAAEIMGIGPDIPAPVYIVDIDDPDAEPRALDRNFRGYVEYFGPNGPAAPDGKSSVEGTNTPSTTTDAGGR